MKMSLVTVRFWGCLLTCGLLSGCGGGSESVPMGTVSGVLKIDNKEFSSGEIHLTSVDQGAGASANLTAGGAFQIDGKLPVGDYKVYITKPSLGDVPPSEDGNPELRQPLKDVAKKYQSEATTDKVVTVSEGANTLDVELTP
ncbi:hypothetical protein [Rubinisphaera sp.]|uniref:hypothetical protein n=1 Tax=Rubinisphaera sp. TaxID=2024857 RepID=UPI0025FF22F0|nr:hypothetical protein [Rubinisphaera sp.]